MRAASGAARRRRARSVEHHRQQRLAREASTDRRAASSPTRISRTRSNPCVMTSMFEVTTASPSRPNFLTYCLWTTSRNCSWVMPEFLEQRRDREERAQERVALHAQLQVAAFGGLPRNLEAGQREHADVLVDESACRAQIGQPLPRLLAFFLGLPHAGSRPRTCRRAGWCG